MNKVKYFQKKGALAVLLLAFFSAGQVFAAQNFTITNRQYTVPGTEAALNLLVDAMEDQVNADLANFEQTKFLTPMADATVLSHKGIGVDYATNPDIFMLGFAVSPAANLGDYTISDLRNGNAYHNTEGGGQIPLVGLSAQMALRAGVNLGYFKFLPDLGIIDLKKLTVYADFFSLDLASTMTNLGMKPKGTEIKEAKFYNIGLHGQYPLLKGKSLSVLKWGGASLTFGFEYTSSTFVLTTSIPTGSQNDGTFELTWDGTADLGSDIGLLSIPIEVSTNVRLFYVLSLFVGAGVDFNMGKASTIAEVTAPVTGTEVSSGLTAFNADANLDMSEEVWATPVDLRFFGGVQFNLPILKFYGMGAYTVNGGYQLAFGGRIAY